MDLQIIIVISFILFGIISIFTGRLKNKTFHYTYIIAISIAILILLVEAVTNIAKRYISLLFILIGLSFLYKQYKLINNDKTK